MTDIGDRFWSKVNKSEDCWTWTAAISRDGYGKFKAGKTMVLAHRFAYEQVVAPIPADRTLDHLCRNRRCVRPDHLEPVTRGENTRRGLATYALRTTCRSGLHDITDPSNVLIRSGGRATCLACYRTAMRAADSRYRDRKRAERNYADDRGFAQSSTCRSGLHDITDPASVIVRPNGDRCCRQCKYASNRAYDKRRRAQKKELTSA